MSYSRILMIRFFMCGLSFVVLVIVIRFEEVKLLRF